MSDRSRLFTAALVAALSAPSPASAAEPFRAFADRFPVLSAPMELGLRCDVEGDDAPAGAMPGDAAEAWITRPVLALDGSPDWAGREGSRYLPLARVSVRGGLQLLVLVLSGPEHHVALLSYRRDGALARLTEVAFDFCAGSHDEGPGFFTTRVHPSGELVTEGHSGFVAPFKDGDRGVYAACTTRWRVDDAGPRTLSFRCGVAGEYEDARGAGLVLGGESEPGRAWLRAPESAAWVDLQVHTLDSHTFLVRSPGAAAGSRVTVASDGLSLVVRAKGERDRTFRRPAGRVGAFRAPSTPARPAR